MTSIRRSLLFSFSEKYGTMLIQFGASLVLARLLTPEEIGIFSVGVVVVGFAHIIRDFGISNYIVQEKELTAQRVRTAFSVTLIIGWLVAGLLFLLAPWTASFYGEAGLEKVMNLLAASVLAIPFSSILMALLRRQMRFNSLCRIGLASAAVNAVTSIVLALLDFGYMSLAWASLAGALTTITAAYIEKPDNVHLRPSLQDFRRIFAFGSYVSLASIVTELGVKAPDLVMGRVIGFGAVGLFSKAMSLVNLFNIAIISAIMPIVLPTFAQQHHAGGNLKESYLKSTDFLSVISWPFFGFLILMAYPLILLLYGDQWVEAVDLSRILALAFAIKILNNFAPSLLIATGRVRENLIAQTVLQSSRFGLTIIAAFHSLAMVAWLQVLYYLIAVLVYQAFMKRFIKLRIQDIIEHLKKSLVVTIIALMPNILLIAVAGVRPDSLWLTLLLAVVGTLLGWLSGIYLVQHPIIMELHPLLRRLGLPVSSRRF